VSLGPGTVIGTYRLQGPLGKGGMGTVYRAADTKLNRAVAIKFLSDERAEAAERRRFQREAQLASALNHPHILTVHDTGDFDGRQYIVSELVEGGTLRDWIKTATRSWQDVVELLIGVADGLAAAHEAGILHRDIKPENILITKSGYAKLADFGVAKMHESSAAAAAAVTETATRLGSVVGTAAYMSPEQALGQPIDARSDVFSFAVVLSEMLAGRRPFEGSTELDTLHAIVHRPPEPLPASIPDPLRTILDKALLKDPAHRVQTMREMVRELRRLARQSGETRTLQPRARLLPWIAVVLTLGAAGATIMFQMSAPPLPVPTEYIPLTNFADSATSPALSPDGRMLTFIRGASTFFGPGQVFVKLLPDGEPTQLTDDASTKMGPQFTPDGKSVSYATGIGPDSATMDMWLVPAEGGTPQRILTNAEGLTWFRNRAGERRVLYSEMTGIGGQMSIVTSMENRGDPRNVYAPPPPDGMAHRSFLSPDGRSLLVAEMDIHSWLPCRLVPFDGSSTGTVVGPAPSQCTDAAWSPDGKWMYFTAMTGNGIHLWRQRFPDGEPEQLTFGAVTEEGIHFAPDGRSFVTSIGASQSTLWVHDVRGDRQITSEGYSFMPVVSPDATKLYYLVRSYGLRSWNQGSLWVADLETGQRQRLLPDFQMVHYSISRDGQRVVFVSVNDEGRSPVWVAPVNGQSPARQLSTMDALAAFFGAPGEVFFGSAGQFNIYRVNETGGDLQKVISAPFFPLAVSPDGRWIAVQDPGAWGALLVLPVDDGPAVRLCDRCAPPWGTETIPFYIDWSPDGGFLYWSFADSAHAIALPPGRMLPQLPAGGIQAKDGVAALPGARLISGQERTFPGPNPSVYAFMKLSTQRNIYRIPVR
jgi:serine/threonine protein kinase/Tol biopolymer transport system component